MPSTYSSNLKIELMSTGENSGTWGNITNTNLGTALEQAIVGYGAVSYASDANLTISITNSNAAQAARALVLNVTSAVSLTATRELVVPTSEKQYIVQNNTTGSQSITVKTSAGTGITVPNGRKAHLYVDGTNVIQMFDFVDINGGTIDGTSIGGSSAAAGAFTTLNASGATTLDGNVTLGNASGDNVTVTGTITSHLLFTDNTYDIGANGATRPRNLFLAGAATIGGNLSVGGTLTLTGGLILNGNVTVGDSSADTLTVNATITSNLLFTDNTYDIGASGATRPRNLFLAGNSTIGGNETVTGTITVDSTTDSSSTTTGSIQTDGGVGIAKKLFVGLDANIYGITVGRGAGAVSTNTAVGASALAANTTGSSNAAFGNNALLDNTSGAQLTALGQAALQSNTSGVDNTAVGFRALQLNTTGGYNTAVGRQALLSNTTASNSTAVGYQAAYSSTTGGENVAIGQAALYTNQTGNFCVAVGNGAGALSTSGGITAIGNYALNVNSTGIANVAVGGRVDSVTLGTLVSNTSGSYNTGIGSGALARNTTASNNTAVGYQAGYSNTTAPFNTFIGRLAGYANTTGTPITAVGNGALYANTTGAGSVAVGSEALVASTTGSFNTAVGTSALYANTTASNNTAVGYQAGYSNTTGVELTALGFQSLYNSTGNYNTGVGYRSLFSNTTGSENTALGDSAAQNTTTGSNNTAIGSIALVANTTGADNTSVGKSSMRFNTTGAYNTAVGSNALQTNTTASYNTAVGYFAGYAGTTATQNTLIGYYAGANLTTGSFNCFIGGAAGNGSGGLMTTGSKNTILGSFSGNQGGLDIRTSSNNTVLSDGDGTPQFVINGNSQSGLFGIPFSGWDSTRYRSLQFGNGTSARYFSITQQFTAACAGSLLWNAYGDGDNAFKYAVSGDKAAMIQISSDAVNIYGAPTGTAGNAVAWETLLGLQRNFSVALQGASGQSGTGITFPATQNASSNANTLDDYEEGTFTPTISPEGSAFSTLTYTYREARYTKIGNTVFINIYLQINSVSGGSSNVNITGLPFTVASGGGNAYPLTAWISATNWSATYDNLVPVALYGGTTVWMTLTSRNNAYGRLQATDLAAGNEWRITGFYNV